MVIIHYYYYCCCYTVKYYITLDSPGSQHRIFMLSLLLNHWPIFVFILRIIVLNCIPIIFLNFAYLSCGVESTLYWYDDVGSNKTQNDIFRWWSVSIVLVWRWVVYNTERVFNSNRNNNNNDALKRRGNDRTTKKSSKKEENVAFFSSFYLQIILL